MRNLFVLLTVLLIASCNWPSTDSNGSSNAHEVTNMEVQLNAAGHTVEQDLIIWKNQILSDPNTLLYLYFISPMSGEVVFQSTARGTVLSSGKRLPPEGVWDSMGNGGGIRPGRIVHVGGTAYYTNEVPDAQGVHGHELEYIYWKDASGRYHQHYDGGALAIHITNYPVHFNHVALNLDILSNDPKKHVIFSNVPGQEVNPKVVTSKGDSVIIK